MKKLMLLLAASLLMGGSLQAAEPKLTDDKKVEQVEVKKKDGSSLAKKALYASVAAGAGVSLCMWIKPALATVAFYGIGHGMKSTVLPRIMLDFATIVACLTALRS